MPTSHRSAASQKTIYERGDDYYVLEIGKDISSLEPIYKSVCTDLEHSPLTIRYVGEVNRMWELLLKSHKNSKRLVEIIKEQFRTIEDFKAKLTAAKESSKVEQIAVDRLTQEVQKALRMVDTAHTREQVSQETVENLRQKITRLDNELKTKSLNTNHDGEFTSTAKTKEAQAKERERMLNEIANLRDRLNSALSYQEELERKNSSADMHITELKQEIENQTNEISKEAKFKERFEEDLVRTKKELVVKDNQITLLNEQLGESQVKAIQLQTNVKDMRALNDKQMLTIEHLNQRIIKGHDDLQREMSVSEELRQTIAILNNQIKMNEEAIGKLLAEATKASTIQETYKKKLNKMEGQKNALEEQQSKLVTELHSLQRSIKDEAKKVKDDKIVCENTTRERDIVNRNLLRANGIISEKEKVIKLSEQSKLYLEHDLDNSRAEINRQTQHIIALEKEKDRHAADAVLLTKRLEAVLEDSKLQQAIISDYKKKITEVEASLHMKIAENDNVRHELNTCSKSLNEAQEDISDFKHKAKVMMLQIEQLKEDIGVKEIQLIREQLALRKAHAEKEAIRLETQKVEHELKETRQLVGKLEVEVKNLNLIIREADSHREHDQKEIEKLTNAREIINTQLVRRNDEVAMLHEKNKTLQNSLDAGENHYTQRLEDIRILKLDLRKLCSEKDILTRSISNVAILRSEIRHLEKELSKEKLKASGMEEELQNPLNIHRWRKLEGSDPTKLELIQKVNMQQKRVLAQAAIIVEEQHKYAQLEQKFQHLEQMLARYQQMQPERELAETCTLKVAQTKKQVRYLLGDLQMRLEQVTELKRDLEKVTSETMVWKEKYYEQKKISEKLMEKFSKKTNKKSKCSNALDLPPIPNKSRFMGGGFNISSTTL